MPGSELKFLDRREKSLKKKEGKKERTKMEGRFDDESRRAIGTRARPITSERKDRKRERVGQVDRDEKLTRSLLRMGA